MALSQAGEQIAANVRAVGGQDGIITDAGGFIAHNGHVLDAADAFDQLGDLFLRTFDAHKQSVVLGEVAGQILGGVVRHDLTVIDDNDAVANGFDLRQDVGGEDHRVVFS